MKGLSVKHLVALEIRHDYDRIGWIHTSNNDVDIDTLSYVRTGIGVYSRDTRPWITLPSWPIVHSIGCNFKFRYWKGRLARFSSIYS